MTGSVCGMSSCAVLSLLTVCLLCVITLYVKNFVCLYIMTVKFSLCVFIKHLYCLNM